MAKKEDNAFYEILGVERTATPAQIRKGYYNQARIWHPDKNPDDPTSEERFKRISQAYQVLSDPNLREVYNQHGEAGLKAKTEGGGMQLSDVLDALFGGGAFEPIFGSIATLSVVQELMTGAMADEKDDESPEAAAERRTKQAAEEQKIIQDLASRLLERISKASEPTFKKTCFEFANELCDAPGGIELLQMVSYTYIQKAKQHSNQFFARVGASLAETGHKASTLLSIGKHLLGARKVAKQIEKEQKEQEEERQKALKLQQNKRIMDFLYSQRSQGHPFLCMRCKNMMLAPLALTKGASVTCSGCNGTQPLNPLFPPLDQWPCSSCTFINDGGAKCTKCETVRPPRVASVVSASPAVLSQPPPVSPLPAVPTVSADTEWTCGACTLVNPVSLVQCSVCGNKRPLPSAIPISSPLPSSPTPIAVPIHVPPLAPIEFEVGATVLVTGLQKRPELNGQLGIVVELPDGKEKTRCLVKLLEHEDIVLSLKPDNLAKPPDETDVSPSNVALQKKLATEGLTLAWKTGKMFLEERVRKVVETAFTMELASGEAAQKEQKNKRSQALQAMGNYYQEAAVIFKEKLAKEGKEEQNLLKGLAQMAAGVADPEEAAKAVSQATAAAAAASARREAAIEKKAAASIAPEAGKGNTGSRRNSGEPSSRGSDERRWSASSEPPVTIHPSDLPTSMTPGVDDTD